MSMHTKRSDSMRLFYALWPDETTRAALQQLQTQVRGRLTRYDNLHLTLAFLGEQPVDKLPLLKKLLADLPRLPVSLSIDRIAYFTKSRIAWAGMHAVPESLMALQSTLADLLVAQGIDFDRKGKFTPHVTLARDADNPVDSPFDSVTWQATQAALVQSLQHEGVLTYRVLAMRNLTEPA